MTAIQKTLDLSSIYRLKVTLKGIKPPIWRRFEVSDQMTLFKLHKVLQVVMGWTDSHLHQFIIGKTYYGEPDPVFGTDTVNDKKVKLAQLPLGEKSKFFYEYDFGDGWEHEILIEKILPLIEGNKAPVCLKGKGACPPKISAESGDMLNSLKLFMIPSIPITKEYWSGSGVSSIRKPSIWKKLTGS